MKKWRFGIIGAGLIADFHAKAVNDIENAQLVGFCDIAPDLAQKLAKKYSCKAFKSHQEMLTSGEVDIVTVATVSGAHMEPTIAAAEAGVHVICEKPLEITLDRIDAMIEAHKKSGTALGGIFQNRFCPAMVPLRQAINSGRFGKITYAGVYVPWWRTDEYYKDSWHGTWKLDGGGALMNQSIHMIDMLCDLMPDIESVQAYTATLGHDIQAEDTATAVLRFSNGALGMIYGSTASYPGQYKRFEITGTKGTVVYLEDSFTTWEFADKTPEDEEILKQFGQVSQTGGGFADPAAISHKYHMNNFKAFIDALDTGEKFSLDGSVARKPVELILAIYKSAKEQKCIKL
jgi:UDP-N-acetyl-2-amino-2-deoxyglucuronate dehydrogenase